MAQGTMTLFEELSLSSVDGRIDMDTDTFKVALVTAVPLAADAVPTWGVGGTTNESATECSAGGGYTAGGITLTTVTLAKAANVGKLDADNVLWTSSFSGDPADIKAAVLYSATATNKDCLAFLDLTADGGTTAISMLTGNVGINWAAGGVITITV